MNKNKKNRAKKILFIALSVVLFFSVFFALVIVQNKVEIPKYRQRMRSEIESVRSAVETVDEQRKDAVNEYNSIMHGEIRAIAYLIANDPDFNNLMLSDMLYLLDVGGIDEEDNLMIVDSGGTILARTSPTQADFTKARFNKLFQCFDQPSKKRPVSVTYLDGSSYNYYSAAIDDENMLVLEVDAEKADQIYAEYSDWKSTLNSVYIGNTGVIRVVDSKTYDFLYCSDDKYEGENALDHGIYAEEFQDGYVGYLRMNGLMYYTGVIFADDEYILCMIPNTEIQGNIYALSIIIALVFLFVAGLMVSYAILLMDTRSKTPNKLYFFKKLPGRIYFNRTLGMRCGIISLLTVLAIFFITEYAQSLLNLSRYSISNEMRLETVKDRIDANQEEYDSVKSYYDYYLINKVTIIEQILSTNPQLLNTNDLYELSELIDVEDILVYDSKGKLTASSNGITNYSLSKDPEDQSYEFRRLLTTPLVITQDPQLNDDGVYMQYAGCSIYDYENGISGIVQIAQSPDKRTQALAQTSIGSILNTVVTDVETVGIAINMNTKTIEAAPDDVLVGRDAYECGFTDTMMVQDYSGYITIRNQKYYASCAETKEYYIFMATPVENISGMDESIAGHATVVCSIGFLILLLILSFGKEKVLRPEDAEKEDDRMSNGFSSLKDDLRGYQSLAERWKTGNSVRWSEQTPEQQLFTMFEDGISLVAIAVTIWMFIVEAIGYDRSIMGFILSGNWEKGWNIFSITASFTSICIGCVICIFVNKLLMALANNLSARGTTICRMLRSATKYIAALIIIFYCLNLLGVNPRTLLVSSAVLTGVIGLGANSLMSDILAGIFLIFEGEFQVGDIVTLGDWRGVVLDIGIRTTKIEDDFHNIKIISNSQVSGIINMTRHLSLALVLLSIDYGESLERVENILAKEFPLIKKKYPSIKGRLYYDNLADWGDNAVILRIIAECEEKDRPALERKLKREFRVLFNKYDINIPYPQITINEQIDYSLRDPENTEPVNSNKDKNEGNKNV